MSVMWTEVMVAGLASLVLGACQPSAVEPEAKAAKERAAKQRAEVWEAEAQLMADPTSAAPELSRRLKQHVGKVGDLVVVRTRALPSRALEGLNLPPSQDFTVTALPRSTPWAVKCSTGGIDVIFGGHTDGSVSEGSGDIGPTTFVSLTNAPLSEERCRLLVVPVGEAVGALLTQDRQGTN